MKKLSHQANELMYLEAILSSYNWDNNLLPLKNVFKRIQHSFWKRFNMRFIYKRRCWMKSVEPWELNMFDPQLTSSKQMEIGDSFLLFSFSFSNCLSLWLQITEGLKKLCGKNTVPQKPKKNLKTPKETNKKKSKGNYNIYIRAAVQILQPTCFFVHDRALSAFHRQVLYMGWMFIRKTYLFSRPERRSGPYNTLGVKGTSKKSNRLSRGLRKWVDDQIWVTVVSGFQF